MVDVRTTTQSGAAQSVTTYNGTANISNINLQQPRSGLGPALQSAPAVCSTARATHCSSARRFRNRLSERAAQKGHFRCGNDPLLFVRSFFQRVKAIQDVRRAQIRQSPSRPAGRRAPARAQPRARPRPHPRRPRPGQRAEDRQARRSRSPPMPPFACWATISPT